MATLIADTSLKIQRIEPLDIMGLLWVVWHGKLIIGASIALALFAAGYYAFAMAQPKFAATATLEIDAASGPVFDIEQVAAGIATDQTSINTQVAILQSKHLMTQVVNTLDLTRDAEFNRYLVPVAPLSVIGLRTRLRDLLSGQIAAVPDKAAVLEKTVENLTVAIRAGTSRDTYIFNITATTGTPDKSALIANTLAQVYLADQVAGKHAATETAVTWLSERVYALQLQLESKETAVNNLIATARVHDDVVLDALSRQAVETQERLNATQDDLQAAQAQLRRLDSQTEVVAATDRPQRRDRLTAEVQRYGNQVAALRVFQTSLNTQLADQSAGLVQLQQLRRESDATRVIYETFLARLQQTSIQRGLQNPDSRVLAAASVGKYVAPRKMLILAIAGLLGGLAGVALVLTRQALRRGFSDATTLTDATGHRVIAQIPRIARHGRGQLLGYLRAKPTSATAEGMRNLRTSLLLADQGRPPQIILSTSSVPGEGKTTQSIALALNLAGLGKSVILIEADLRQGAFRHYFDFAQNDGQGLNSVIGGRAPLAQAVVHDAGLGADVLCAGTAGDNPADLFSGAAFAALLAQLRQSYDFIVLDAPPVLPVPDARLLAQYADAVLYTVQWEKTPADLVCAGLRELDSINAARIGLVLSQIDGIRMRQYGRTYFANYGQAYYQN
ncbi:GNVR domain-containing protein [Yoonia sp.]|uniref:AAA family ATPase n=1 Tax=Yoonia sp. TaxID=2212373 RepID=UPI0025FDC4CC|nr:GNVR domain-containing protein [Yoonia sp.]